MDNEELLEKFLSDVEDACLFWVSSGERLRNLEELSNALENMSDEVFAYHVNEFKNDFSNWIRNCIGDIALAESLTQIPVKNEAAKKIKERVKEIKNIKKSKALAAAPVKEQAAPAKETTAPAPKKAAAKTTKPRKTKK